MSPQTGVRVGVVCIFAVLATVFGVEKARSQPTRPGGIPRPPSFPKPPTFTPPTFTPPSIPRGPLFENVWSCGKCKAELGRGNVKPSYDSCPKCGVRFINGGGGGTGGFGLVTPPPPLDNGNTGNNSPPPSFGGNAAPADPDLIPRGNSGSSNNNSDTQTFTAPKSTPDSGTVSAAEEKPASKTGSMILKIMIGVFALLFLVVIAGGIFLIAAANKGSKPAKKSRRRRLDDEDD
jgi:hypothetical protein